VLCWHAPRATARPPATLPVRRARRTDPLLRRAARRGPPGGGPQLLDGWGYQATRPTRRAGSAVQAQAAGRSRIGAVAADCSTSAPTAPAHCRVRSRVGARARPPPAGLAAQPLPHRPGRSPTRLRPRRAARQRQRRRSPAGHHLAVAPQSVQPPRPGHAHPQPRRRPPAGRRRPPAQRPAGHPGALPARERPAAALFQWVRRDEEYATLGANVVVELNSESRAASPPAGPGRSAASTAPTATPANVKAVASAGRPTVPPAATAPADRTNLRSGGWSPMLADRTPPLAALDAGGQLVSILKGESPGFSSVVAATGHGGLIRDRGPSAVLSRIRAGRADP
jgi:hypothetical protein